MAWFPWVAMPKRSQRPDELIDWLRYSAIAFGAPAQFVDGIEELYAFSVQDGRIEELEEELDDEELYAFSVQDGRIEELEEELDDLKNAVNALLEAIEGGDPDVIKPAIEEIRELL